MNNLNSIRYIGALAILGLASCSTTHSALRGESDDLYFMASDAQVATEFAVENNNPENFKPLKQIKAEEFNQENFSSKNVNPEYIAKYQNDNKAAEEGTVYFDDAEVSELPEGDGDINIYNNFRGNTGGSNFNSGWNMNPYMMSSMYMGGFSPWGMGGMYDPFWGSGYGFRPGFNLSLGMGFGFGNRFGMGFGNPYRYGMGGFYDPFYSPYMGMGYYNSYYNRPIIILPGGSENQRQIVRGSRPSRGSNLAGTSGVRTRDNLASPSSTRSSARREAVSRNSMTSTPNSRTSSSRDFSRSQNDYYNTSARGSSTASASPVRRSINSPAMSRTGSTSSRDTYTAPSNTRSQAPANVNSSRSSTDSRARYASPSGSSSPSYNRSSSPRINRTTTPTRNNYSTPTPSRSSSPSYSAPSRSSGSSSGASRSSGGSSRRGN